jgi:thymidylate synthase ThyX
MENQAKIFLVDDRNPEDVAMLQALYSRSAESVEVHLAKVKAIGSGKFMERYYIEYNHDSIGDCGSTTLFIEGLSILADKIVQDWPLYKGQETSTRYVDMARQPIIDPLGTSQSKQILDDWMAFYIKAGEPLKEHLHRLYPRQANDKEDVYERAIKARAFDILRAWLPAGITTQLSWHTDLRQAKDKLALMLHHPLPEAQEIAKGLLATLKERYPSSFTYQPTEEQEIYREMIMEELAYYEAEKAVDFTYQINLNKEELKKYKQQILQNRPPKTCLPIVLNELGNIRFDFILDYGSFRDLQRHRNGVCRIPLLSTKLGFNKWYLSELTEDLRQEGEALLVKQIAAIAALDASAIDKQYYTALGFNVTCRVAYPLMPTVYTLELRSGKAVHPTMRAIAHKMHAALTKELPFLKLHSDLEASDWDVQRGTHTILEKK